MITLTFPWVMWLGLGIYVLLLVVTVVHIVGSRRARGDKTIAVLGVVLLPVGGILGWWLDVVWGSRADQLARRKRSQEQHLADKPKVGK